MATNTAAIRVGRLLEIRAEVGYRTSADVDEVFDTIEREVRKLARDERHVAAVDWRRCPVMSPEAAGRITQRLELLNGRTQRSAALVNGGRAGRLAGRSPHAHRAPKTDGVLERSPIPTRI
jgi:hypothetical protein